MATTIEGHRLLIHAIPDDYVGAYHFLLNVLTELCQDVTDEELDQAVRRARASAAMV